MSNVPVYSKFPPSMAVSTLCRVASVISSEGIVPLVSVYIFLHGIDGPLYRAYPEYLPVTAISETNRKRTEVFCLKREKEKKKRLYIFDFLAECRGNVFNLILIQFAVWSGGFLTLTGRSVV